eukprot:CAMPEP_0195035162 /NCGR_PEP_ID=MMETSP0326_2-20130528/69459_1 /TAXON_ID=2866 ORGANISM="Crypthecodinium cohnii, Strain Seligo" /NCGR_SAMPLE_ID=MMETSP0326_2 /ASSEMBLY_ACC=CAM_ASM_000348 /LENGTH=67 /DNA_ID=CAMNT_0040060227 /DNA_START=142 /DNA_END=342 /DNA_ORIENTATION=-
MSNQSAPRTRKMKKNGHAGSLLQLSDLAHRLLEELPLRTQITDAKYVYIYFVKDNDEEPVQVSPWDW